MTAFLGTFRIGEDFAIALTARSGDPTGYTATAWLVRSIDKVNFSPANSAPIELTVTERAPSGSLGAGWNITVTAAQSGSLQPGWYGIDARIEHSSGSIDITDTTALIEMTRSAVPLP